MAKRRLRSKKVQRRKHERLEEAFRVATLNTKAFRVWSTLIHELHPECPLEVVEAEWRALCSSTLIAHLSIKRIGSVVSIYIETTRIIVKVPDTLYGLLLGRYGLKVTIAEVYLGNPNAPTETLVGFTVECVESGRVDKQKCVSYSVEGDIGFCFGSGRRGAQIKQLTKECELFGLITLVLDSFWHLNEPQNFRDVFTKVQLKQRVKKGDA
jgi:hypothetical protein